MRSAQTEFKRWLIIAIAAGGALVSAAAVIVTPIGASSTTFIGSGDRVLTHTIDSTGLSGGGTSGDILTETHTPNNANTGTYWLSANLGGNFSNEVLTFSLGGAFDIDTLHQWVYTRNGETDRGLETFDLFFSTDGGGTYPASIDATTLGDFLAPAGVGSFVPQSKSFSLQTGVTHVELRNLANFGDPNYIGLSEIRFGGPDPVMGTIPEPGSMALGALLVLGLAYGIRRQRRA